MHRSFLPRLLPRLLPLLLVAGFACDQEPEPEPAGTCVAVASSCNDLALEVPGPRGEVVGTWDGERQRMVLFGGDSGLPQNCIPRPDFVGSTWSFRTDCDAFVLLDTEDAPAARGRHVGALDADRSQMLVHGGRWRATGTSGNYTLRSDLWAFDFATDTWAELDPGTGPSARVNHVGVVAGDRFLIHGGDTDPGALDYVAQDEVWAFDLISGVWEELDTAGGPGARIFHSGTSSLDGSTLYVYGGTGNDPFFSPAYDDLWALDLENLEWTELHDGSGDAPDRPFWGNLLADPTADRLLLWAGHDDTSLGNTNQLWAFDLGSGEWDQVEEGDVFANPANAFCDFPADFVEPDLSAPERRNAGAAAITDCGEIVVFGGKTDCGIINDLWAWDSDAGWQERSAATAGQICLRSFADCDSLCF